MSKYIIELDDRIKLVTSVGVTENGVVYTTSDYVNNLEELNSDYINEHYGDLQDTAYQRGFEDGKAVNDKGCEGCKYAEMGSDTTICAQCCNAYHNQWTAEQTDDEIKVGDEVVALDECMMVMSDLLPWIVTSEGINYYRGIDMNGESRSREKGRVRKTGRHFDIASILKEMQS